MKRIFAGLILFMIFGTAFSEINWFSEAAEHTLGVNLAVESESSALPYRVGFQGLYELDMTELETRAGMNFGNQAFNFFTEVKYTPTILSWFRAGPFFNYHIFSYDKVYIDNDIILGGCFQFHPQSFFSADIRIGWFFKDSCIYSLEDSAEHVPANGLGIRLNFAWEFFDALRLSFTATSYEDFYYQIFLAPSFIFGAEYKLPGNLNQLKVGGEVSFRYVDFFTLSGYLESIEFKLLVKYTL